MSTFTPSDLATLKSSYESAGQSHVFKFWADLTPAQQDSFFAQLSSIDPLRVKTIFENAVKNEGIGHEHDKIDPPSPEVVASTVDTPEKVSGWNATGLKAIKEGKVGVLLLAGGQGTRLGSSDPKGMYDIGLPSGKSLFQLQAERIGKVAELAGQKEGIVWYIMTSGPTRKATEGYFEKNGYFGLKKENVVFFEQGVLPALTNDGKIFLDTSSSLAVAPDGNGGVYAALRRPLSPSTSTTVLSDIHSRGVQYLHAYCVDNCLVRVGDPVFVGYCIEKGAQCGAKVVKKTVANEKVGVVALREGKYEVVEYSEIPEEMSQQKDGKGELVYRAANIVNHFYTTAFLEKVENWEKEMAFHIARKKIPHIDLVSGEKTSPSSPNGMKLEMFIFDVFPFVTPSEFGILEESRNVAFSPLKNAKGTGSDDADTSRRDLLKEFRRWLTEAGAEVAEGVEVELAPSVSFAGEGLEGVKGKKITKSGNVQTKEELQALLE